MAHHRGQIDLVVIDQRRGLFPGPPDTPAVNIDDDGAAQQPLGQVKLQRMGGRTDQAKVTALADGRHGGVKARRLAGKFDGDVGTDAQGHIGHGAARSTCPGSKPCSAPIWRARSRRNLLGSAAITWRAPRTRAAATAIRPMGPQPLIKMR